MQNFHWLKILVLGTCQYAFIRSKLLTDFAFPILSIEYESVFVPEITFLKSTISRYHQVSVLEYKMNSNWPNVIVQHTLDFFSYNVSTVIVMDSNVKDAAWCAKRHLLKHHDRPHLSFKNIQKNWRIISYETLNLYLFKCCVVQRCLNVNLKKLEGLL